MKGASINLMIDTDRSYVVSKTDKAGARRIVCAAVLLLVLGVLGASSAQAEDPPQAEQKVASAAIPATTANRWTWQLTVPADKAKKRAAVIVNVSIVGIPAISWVDTPVDREITRYSKFKAEAIADCINENKDAQKYGIKATVEATQGPITRINPQTRKAYKKNLDLSKVVIVGIEKLKPIGDPTKESFNDRTTTEEIPGGSMDTMKPRKVSLSTGVDPNGDPSIVSFGLSFESNNSSLESNYLIATVYPEPAETPAEVMMDLADSFNSQFASQGYTLIYDSLANKLTTNQVVPWGVGFVSGNNDTGLDFDFDMLTSSVF